MNFFTKASLTAGIVFSSVFTNAVNASAAVFNFTFDSTVDSTLTSPFVGSGTLSFDGAATVGSYSLASLSNLNMNFSFTDGSSFSKTDVVSNLSASGISIFNSGSGNLGLVFTGNPAFSFLNNSSQQLAFEPTNSISNSIGLFGGNGVTNIYQTDVFLGSYNAVSTAQASTSVPEPFTVIGSLVGGTAALRMRKKLKHARTK